MRKGRYVLRRDLRNLKQLRRAVVRDDSPALDVVHRLRRHLHRKVGTVVRHEAEQLCVCERTAREWEGMAEHVAERR